MSQSDPKTSNVVHLADYKKKKAMNMTKHQLYQLSKAELLDQLIQYYETVKKDPFSLSIALWGEDLMDVISARALTRELSDLAEQHRLQGPTRVFKLD